MFLTVRRGNGTVNSMQSPLHRLIDAKLGGDGALAELVACGRVDGFSWRVISAEVRTLTGIDVTHETVRSWFPELVSEAAS